MHKTKSAVKKPQRLPKQSSSIQKKQITQKPIVRQMATKSPYSNARKVVCVGRNFADHAKELGNAVPTQPVLFLKPPSCLIMEADPSNNKIEVPPGCSNLHHEVELGVVIGKGGRDIKIADADSHIAGYFLGLDMTAREIQNEAKTKGLPWSVAKGYDTFGPISPPIAKDAIKDTTKLRLTLDVNGKRKQDGNTDMMLFPVAELIAYISTIFTLEEGDLIYTGTPAGVGPVVPGDVIKCGLEDTVTNKLIQEIQFSVINRPVPMAKL